MSIEIKMNVPGIISVQTNLARKRLSRQVKPMAATKNTEKEVREPLIHITKRDEMPWWQSWLVRITAVFLALIVAGVVTIMLTGQNPLEVYATMFKGGFRHCAQNLATDAECRASALYCTGRYTCV